MCIGHKQTVDIIFLQCLHALDASAAAVLGLEVILAHTLDIAKLGDRDNDIFSLDQILRVKVRDIISDLRSAVVTVFIPDDQDLFADDTEKKLLITEDCSQLRDQLHQLFMLCLDLASFQTCQRSQTHIDDRLSLHVIQPELLHQRVLGCLHVLGRADDPDHFIDIVQSDQQSLQDMISLLRFIQLILRAAGDHFLLMLQVIVEHLQDVHDLRLIIHQREHDDSESILQLCVQEEFI